MKSYTESGSELESIWNPAVEEPPEAWKEPGFKRDRFLNEGWDTELRGIPEYDSPLAD